ncbi:MAG: hypothetical protein ACTSPM_05465 [Candidatus Heimdallarchaeota archaeon]
MLTNNTDEEQNKTSKIKVFDNFIKYLFGLAFLFCILPQLDMFIDYSSLDPRLFDAILLLFIISMILILLSIIIFNSPFIFQLLKHRSLTRNDLSVIENEQTKPMKNSYKIRRILLWFCSFGALTATLVRIAYLIVLIGINLYSQIG